MGVHVPKRMGNGQMAGKRDWGPARKASTYNLFEWADPLCNSPEVGLVCALMWSMVELHLHLHLVILQTLLSKATYNWGIHQS